MFALMSLDEVRHCHLNCDRMSRLSYAIVMSKCDGYHMTRALDTVEIEVVFQRPSSGKGSPSYDLGSCKPAASDSLYKTARSCTSPAVAAKLRVRC